jgi:hypothetical protein
LQIAAAFFNLLKIKNEAILSAGSSFNNFYQL